MGRKPRFPAPFMNLHNVRNLAVALLLALAFTLAACQQKPAAPAAPADPTSTPSNTKTNFYFVKGVIKELKPDGRTAIIEHEAIPNYMEAMTMPLRVKNTNELANLHPGDQIFFRMVVTDFEGWIDQVSKTGKAPPTASTSAATNTPATKPKGAFRRVRDVLPLNIGDAVPDYPLTNHLGQAISLGQFKGQALALTFIFTRCPFPEFCPRMENNFQATAKKLIALPNAPTNWHLLSITFDVEFDTPAVLKGYAARHPAAPAHWSHATGAQIEIDALTEQFGLGFAREGTIFNHNLRTIVIDAAGRVQSVLIGNEWKPEELIAELVKAAKVAPAGAAGTKEK